MGRYNFTNEEYRQAVLQAKSIAEVCRNLGILPKGANYDTIRAKISELNLDASHFVRIPHNKGKLIAKNPKRDTLKKHLIHERGHQCQKCENTEWLGQPITLELEHIDGDNQNNERSNLLLLCPNCHSQTPTWRRAKSSFSPKLDLICPECNGTKLSASSICQDCRTAKLVTKRVEIKAVKRPYQKRAEKFCKCGNHITHEANQCSECLHKAQERIVWPAPEELATRLRTTSYTALGRELGVSDNAIRKYLRKHGYDTKTLQKVDPA